MSNEFYSVSGVPATGSPGSSATIRAEFSNIAQGFDKLPPLAGQNNRVVKINAAGTGLETGSLIPAGDVVGTTATQTLTNKTIDLASNTLLATSAQLATAISDETGSGALVFAGSPALTGAPTAPTAVAGTNTTQLATTAHVFAERSNTFALTNKTISGASNTLSDIANASLSNSAVTVGSTSISLGATATTLAGLSSVTSTTFVGALTGNATNVTGTVAVANGGTDATTAAQAKINLQVISAATGSSLIPTGTTGQRDGSPVTGYFRFNTSLSKFEGYNGTTWGAVGGGATGGGSDEVFIENNQSITVNYTIPGTRNAMSTGPLTVNDGITVTVSDGARWVIL